MGILTVMKLSVFVVAALSLILALAWLMIYCPSSKNYFNSELADELTFLQVVA